MLESINHTLSPWVDAQSRVLVLGTMPSPKSRQTATYYGNPQNRFWKTLAALWQASVPQGADACRAFALARRIALWDVLASCVIDGASDASIREPIANDIATLLAQYPIRHVFTTGAKAHALYKSLIYPQTQLLPTALPSPSPANRAHWPDEALVEAYRPLYLAAKGVY